MNTLNVAAPCYPLPSIGYWSVVFGGGNCTEIFLDASFRKMSYHNRYYVTTAQGLQTLTIPIIGGRNQRISLAEVEISYEEAWQKKHWRCIQSAYGNAAFYEHYAPYFLALYEKRYHRLIDFNLASIEVCKTLVGINNLAMLTTKNIPEMHPFPSSRKEEIMKLEAPIYHQVFADRHGFIPALSLLDLIMNEGPAAKDYLTQLYQKNEASFHV